MPCIAFIALDAKEARKVTCTYDHPKCEHPCWICMVKKGKLGASRRKLSSVKYRDAKKVDALVTRALLDPRDAEAANKLWEQSIHPVKVYHLICLVCLGRILSTRSSSLLFSLAFRNHHRGCFKI